MRATRPNDPSAPDFVKQDGGLRRRAAGRHLSGGGRAGVRGHGRAASVAEEDVKKAAIPVLRHRVSTNFQAQAEGKTSDDIIRQLLAVIPARGRAVRQAQTLNLGDIDP